MLCHIILFKHNLRYMNNSLDNILSLPSISLFPMILTHALMGISPLCTERKKEILRKKCQVMNETK